MTAPVFDVARIGPGEGSIDPRTRLRTDAPSQSLDGRWSFRLSPSPALAPHDEWTQGETEGWDEITVPAHWNMSGFGTPAYSNVQFPFPIDPPYPPDENPVGDYVRRIDVDAEIRQVMDAGGRALLRFDGIESAADVFVNGIRLGSTRGSRLTHEFDVTDRLTGAGDVIAVRVAQFSDGTYLENQDMWWLPGIFRSVTLLARPVGGIDDAVLTGDFDHETGHGAVAVTTTAGAVLEVPELGIRVDVAAGRSTVDAGAVEPWSAETPRLYDATLATASETVSVRLGFRRVRADDGVLTLNGRPIMLRGVNRHEHDPDRGRVHTTELARRDLVLMKQHNINAVRTSHYPPHPELLDLADELGLYVIDECDLETHEYEYVSWRGNPSDDPAWEASFVDRIRRTVTRDRTHPSVIMWSLGNESGAGCNIRAMARWVRENDATRLIHYEGDHSSRDTDVYSRMYASHDEVRRIGEESDEIAPAGIGAAELRRRSLPFVHCEFGHAMGNSPGGVKEYWELYERFPRLAGGFIWEWIEHAIAIEDEHGRRAFRYGGDFGESVHDHNFVIDGLISADRDVRPGLVDYAAIIAPLVITVEGDRRGIRLENRYDHVDTSHLAVTWRREVDGVVVAQGELDVPPIAPRQRGVVPLPAEARTVSASSVADVLTIVAALRDATSWAQRGHVVATGQRVDAGAPRLGAAAAPDQGEFDRRGRPLRLGSLDVVEGPGIGIWRAPTDNDLFPGWDEPTLPPMAERWALARIDRMQTRVRGIRPEATALVVDTRVGAPSFDSGVDALWRWSDVPEGRLLELDLRSIGSWDNAWIEKAPFAWTVDWARLGIDVTLAGAPVGMEFAGYGPGPSYPDTDSGVHFGWFEAGADELVTPHVRPQESGSRRGVRTAVIRTSEGEVRVSVVGGEALDAGVALTVSPWDRTTLSTTSHASLLPAPTATHVSIDIAQSGVGTATCGPGVLPRHRLPARDASFALLFETV